MLTNNIKSIIDLIEEFPNEETCIKYLEKIRWDKEIPKSPWNRWAKVYRCKNGKYKCTVTKKYFNVKTGTIFEGTKLPLKKWFIAIWLITSFKPGISSVQLSQELGITQAAAWVISQKIKQAMFSENKSILRNQVEADEAWINGKNENRHWKAIQKLPAKGRSTVGQKGVLGMIERKGNVVARKIPSAQSQYVVPHLRAHIINATLNTDEASWYRVMRHYMPHTSVNHGKKEYVRDNCHTNTIENFWAYLRRGLIGIYRQVSHKHFQRYLNEFVFRFNTRSSTQYARFNRMLANCNTPLTYKQLTNG